MLALLLLGIVTLLMVTIALRWSEGYQVAGLLLLIAVVVGLADGQSPSEVAANFVQGARELTMGARGHRPGPGHAGGAGGGAGG